MRCPAREFLSRLTDGKPGSAVERCWANRAEVTTSEQAERPVSGVVGNDPAENLVKPHDRGFSFLPSDLIHGAAVANAIAKFGQLVELLSGLFLSREGFLEFSPKNLRDDAILQVSKIEILKHTAGRRIVSGIQGGVFLKRARDALVDFLEDVRRDLS